jgi:hypothetical protein
VLCDSPGEGLKLALPVLVSVHEIYFGRHGLARRKASPPPDADKKGILDFGLSWNLSATQNLCEDDHSCLDPCPALAETAPVYFLRLNRGTYAALCQSSVVVHTCSL